MDFQAQYWGGEWLNLDEPVGTIDEAASIIGSVRTHKDSMSDYRIVVTFSTREYHC